MTQSTIVSLLTTYNGGRSHLPTISKLFHNAAWLERELGDNYSITFSGLRDKRSLYQLPLFFTGTKRRAFPVTGFYELRWDAYLNSLTYFRVAQV